MFRERASRPWFLTVFLGVSACFAFPGIKGEVCTEEGLCGSVLACDLGRQRCVDPECLGGKCGDVAGVDCGGCVGTDQCQQNQCVVPGYVLIQSGTFTMGSPAGEPGRGSDESRRSVTLTRDFWLKETEVTEGEWLALMGYDPYSALGPACDLCPAQGLTWFEAVEYLNALSRSEGLPECYTGPGMSKAFEGLNCLGYRLPTEAEWEYAARAGTTEARYGELDAIAWHSGNAGRKGQPVGGKQPNPWGLFDMLGNVWEWTNDRYEAYGVGTAVDPLGPAATPNRVYRGGSYGTDATGCRAADRVEAGELVRSGDIGFRPARSAP
jgi:sulfatase modifying factor 1